MEAIIEDIVRKASVYISVGTLVKDLVKHDEYEITKVEKSSITLEHKPVLRAEKKDDLTIRYDELVHVFSNKRFFIQGFSHHDVENGCVNDLDKLEGAVRDTRNKIKLEEERAELAKVSAQKSELELEKEEALRQKEFLEQEKLKVLDEKESLVQKRKSKIRAKHTRQEAELAEQERIENERIARQHKIKLLNKKRASMQMRLRLFTK